jgi:uncharacterized membrane protein
MSNKLYLGDFERLHARACVPRQVRPSLRELFVTLLVALVMAPFAYVTFMIIPLMGPITVLFAIFLTGLYVVFRRSLLVAMAIMGGSLFFWSLVFLSIQSIKNSLEIPLFFFTATGIPMCAVYMMFIGTRIWTIRGGAQ